MPGDLAYLYAKPEKAAELKERLTGLRRTRTLATTSVNRAGLAANDACSNYVAPTTATLTLPTSSDQAQAHA